MKFFPTEPYSTESCEMKSIGLLTIHGIKNCGSLLQTYATVRVVSALGYNCQVIDYLFPSYYHLCHATGDENGNLGLLKGLLNRLGLLLPLKYIKSRLMRRKALAWLRGRLGETGLSRSCDRRTIRRLPAYDIYLTGSDQVWNPRYGADDETFLLGFTPEDAGRVAYAASFGCRELPEQFKRRYGELLRRYNAISVREPSGVGIVRSVADKAAVAVLDPTLLLQRADYLPLAGSRFRGRRFVFCYVLSYVFDAGSWVIDLARTVAKALDAEVIFHGDNRGMLRNARTAGFEVLSGFLPVEDFLECYERAEFVITTSFHGTAFSLNFQKNFYAVLNPNATKDDRVASILDRVGLANRGVRPGADLSRVAGDLTVDYGDATARLAAERESSRRYLENALKGVS